MPRTLFYQQYPQPDDLPDPVIGDPALPLISIITPSYNQGRFIRQTVESVLGQEYPNLEYWVIDGGSSDQTPDILREYEDDPRFHWIGEKDRGQSDAINKGLARSRGEIFAWLNSDDLLTPGALQEVSATWISTGSPAILYGLAHLVDEEGQVTGFFPAHSPDMSLEKLLSLKYIFAQPATYAPTRSVIEIGGIDPSYHMAMDLDLWIRLAEMLPIRHIPKVLACFREHRDAKSTALTPAFIHDSGRVMERAVSRSLVTSQQATANLHLFVASRIYLMPEHNDWGKAWQAILTALKHRPALLPEALIILLKALVRRLEGKGRWRFLRSFHARLRQIGL